MNTLVSIAATNTLLINVRRYNNPRYNKNHVYANGHAHDHQKFQFC